MAALEPVIAEYMKREPAHLVTPALLDILTGYGEKIICSVNAGGAVALTVTIASPSQQLQRHQLQPLYRRRQRERAAVRFKAIATASLRLRAVDPQG